MSLDLNSFFPSNWLTVSDITEPVTLDISMATAETMPDGANKCAIHFSNGMNPMLLNKTNFLALAEIAGTPDAADWTGVKIEVYQTTTRYLNDTVPCLRIRRPPNRAGVEPAPRQPTRQATPR